MGFGYPEIEHFGRECLGDLAVAGGIGEFGERLRDLLRKQRIGGGVQDQLEQRAEQQTWKRAEQQIQPRGESGPEAARAPIGQRVTDQHAGRKARPSFLAQAAQETNSPAATSSVGRQPLAPETPGSARRGSRSSAARRHTVWRAGAGRRYSGARPTRRSHAALVERSSARAETRRPAWRPGTGARWRWAPTAYTRRSPSTAAR